MNRARLAPVVIAILMIAGCSEFGRAPDAHLLGEAHSVTLTREQAGTAAAAKAVRAEPLPSRHRGYEDAE